jgi:MinD superfamily P-loop ATPase
MRVPDFENVADQLDLLRLVPLPKPVRRWVRRQWTARPQIIDGRCTRCGICEKGCPVPTAAIHPETENLPKVDEARCIRCYCCHEFCPAQAITLEQSWVGRHVPLNAIADRLGGWLGFLLARRR